MAGDMSLEFVINFSIYPEGIYQQAVRALMYTLIPAAFIVHIPLRIVREFNPWLMVFWLAAAFAYGAFSVWFFYRGLKRYESGNIIVTRM
jgi:ABC-2 type transport system permease protein